MELEGSRNEHERWDHTEIELHLTKTTRTSVMHPIARKLPKGSISYFGIHKHHGVSGGSEFHIFTSGKKKKTYNIIEDGCLQMTTTSSILLASFDVISFFF